MLNKGWQRVQKQNLSHVTLQKMDATRMDFPDNTFDSVFAAYVISTVPEPKIVVEEMVRVCKNGGKIVFLNHFKNGKKWISVFEKSVSPLCKRIGFRTDLDLGTILKDTPLVVNRKNKIHRFHFWRAVQCINQKENGKQIEKKEGSSKKLRTHSQNSSTSNTLDISQEYSPNPICPR
jgi:phosphatidylethanolamine/phosphatidyl-N-methylethanolamine N-methyltransferase